MVLTMPDAFEPGSFEQMWAELAPVGRSPSSGGYFRQPFLSAERELSAWFEQQCRARHLVVERDAFGNLVGWWDPGAGIVPDDLPVPGAGSPAERQGVSRRGAVLTGSHMDSVLDGGAYDGPLGVVSALAAVDALRARGFVPSRALGVSVFVEEEGSRFGLACLGSRLATGTVSWERARELTDREGTYLADAIAADPVDGAGSLLADVVTFVELHVEQGRDLVDRGAAVGVASGIWPHGRYRYEFRGAADHAGTTRMEDRADPMLSYAMTALAANKQARLSGERATFGRLDVTPNSTNSVPSAVTAWLDARASTPASLDELVGAIERQASDRAGRDGTTLVVTPESVSDAVFFDRELAARLAGPRGWPVIPTAAGHDAGILSAAGIPTAMLFVRNPTGVSHSPLESATMADCLAGVEALADVLAELAGDAA
jgi:N-carbamoyl-L-amino-acid hydrolase